MQAKIIAVTEERRLINHTLPVYRLLAGRKSKVFKTIAERKTLIEKFLDTKQVTFYLVSI